MSKDLTFTEFAASTPADWTAAAEESLKGAPLSKLATKTPEGLTLKPIYTAEDIAAIADTCAGKAPYTRGSSAMGKAPLIAQTISAATPAEFNTALLDALNRGQNALSLCFCDGTFQTLADIKTAFNKVVPSAINIVACGGASALPAIAMLESVSKDWQGAILGDPVALGARSGKLPSEELFDEMAVAVKWSKANGSKVRTVGVSTFVWSETGASAVEELAFSLGRAIVYLRALEKRGISPAEAADQFVFTVSLGSNVFMQISKLRALRLLWSRILEACGAPAIPAYIHARCTMFNKSQLDPYTNILRATTEAFAGVIGGADSLDVATFDEVARDPNEFSRRVARNIQSILIEECHFADVADAAGGSYFVETETVELAKKAWELLQQMEAKGGMPAALREGVAQAMAAATREARLKAVGSRRDGVIGVNLFPNLAEKPLEGARKEKSCACACAPTEKIAPIAPTLEAIKKAFTDGATYAQVNAALPRKISAEVTPVTTHRAAEGFETLRAAAAGKNWTVWLANFGPAKQHKARADFSAGFFAAGGFKVKQGKGSDTVETAVSAAIEAAAPVVAICSTDETYPDLVPAFAKALKATKPETILIVAGNPTEHIDTFKAAGVDDFIHIRVNCQDFLAQLQKKMK